ncbi:MAG: hypothetical protein FWC23_04335 [Chitinispirillia bacterium]|nr:hypothetical protein [Chitinispirillia bacterium]MCL2268394.1 hypothetical protein [Chitinispirillia bacterium]
MKPIVLAMLVCDYYYRDFHTGKSILAGTFSSINSAGFPTKHGNCAIYIALTDVAADSTSQLIFRREGGPPLLSMSPWEVAAPENRRAVVEIGGNLSGLPLPEEGEYEFVLLWNGIEIAHRRLIAAQIGRGSGPEPEPFDDYNLL